MNFIYKQEIAKKTRTVIDLRKHENSLDPRPKIRFIQMTRPRDQHYLNEYVGIIEQNYLEHFAPLISWGPFQKYLLGTV
jgi:hypothetical protein